MGRALTILSDSGHWVEPRLAPLVAEWRDAGHTVTVVPQPSELPAGELLFLLGCTRKLSPQQLSRHRHNLVVHESDLPRGRGFAPLTWQVLEGKRQIPVVLFEADDRIDAGPIYLRTVITLRGDELVGELRDLQIAATIGLCRSFVERYPAVLAEAAPQRGEATVYRRRTPEDSRLDPDKSLREQFELLRVADPERYPAFVELNGRRYYLTLGKEPPCPTRP